MLRSIPIISAFRGDPLIITATWALIIAIIVGTVLLALWLQCRDQRIEEAVTGFLPVPVLGTKARYADYLLFRAYIPESDRDFVTSKLKMSEERTFERLAPGDVTRLQKILETAYVAWVNDGRPS